MMCCNDDVLRCRAPTVVRDSVMVWMLAAPTLAQCLRHRRVCVCVCVCLTYWKY